jgi:hypothetical protein
LQRRTQHSCATTALRLLPPLLPLVKPSWGPSQGFVSLCHPHLLQEQQPSTLGTVSQAAVQAVLVMLLLPWLWQQASRQWRQQAQKVPQHERGAVSQMQVC